MISLKLNSSPIKWFGSKSLRNNLNGIHLINYSRYYCGVGMEQKFNGMSNNFIIISETI